MLTRRQDALSEPLSDHPRLYYGGQASVRRALFARAAAVFGLVLFVVAIFWFDREGLRDAQDDHLSFIDILYFTAVSVTTTGYGDIVPITERARLIDAAIITPVRLVIWMIFFGTAYQLLIQRTLERIRIRRRQARMKDHVVVCGFGNGGESAAHELVTRGTRPDCIVVVDRDENALHRAAECGHVGLRGDVTREVVLAEARVESARAVVISLDDDATTVLAVLTVRYLAPHARILARVQEEENEKLVRQSGADVTLQSARLGGVLLANALEGPAVLDYVVDLVTAAGHLHLKQRPAGPDEIGRPPGRCADGLVVQVLRAGRRLSFWDPSTIVAQGDELIVLGPGSGAEARA
jgi:voltage-gated potassium channel